MKFFPEKVLIIGGTGFLGFHSALEFLKRHIAVSSVSIPDVELGDWVPDQLEIISDNFDVFTADLQKLTDLMGGFDTVIYAVGPDDRITPPAPSQDFFHEKLVFHPRRAADAARNAGVRRFVVLNSYFAYFDSLTGGSLASHHPYIKARVQQAEALIKTGESEVMDVMILQLPYIFGCMPGREPLWKKVFLDRFEKMPLIMFPGGGSVMIHVRGVAQAVVAAAINGEHGQHYQIGLTNMKFKKMITLMLKASGSKKKILTVPTSIAALGGSQIKKHDRKLGLEGGLDYSKLMTDIQSKDFYYNVELIQQVQESLNYSELDFDEPPTVEQGIRETIQACYPELFPEFKAANLIRPDLEKIKRVWNK
jgi:nucleoside-diphosphate-sugar epimerase